MAFCVSVIALDPIWSAVKRMLLRRSWREPFNREKMDAT